MAITYSYGKQEIKINESDSIILETKSEEVYEWKEVTFKTKEQKKEIYIGTYYTRTYPDEREWMEYNDNFIAILAGHKHGHIISDVRVMELFDINSRKLIKESQEEMREIYAEQFKLMDLKRVRTLKNKTIN